MTVSYPKPIIEKKSSQLEDMDLAFSASLVRRNNHFYLSMHDQDIRFWDLEAGDEILIKIVKVKKRVRPVYIGKEEVKEK